MSALSCICFRKSLFEEDCTILDKFWFSHPSLSLAKFLVLFPPRPLSVVSYCTPWTAGCMKEKLFWSPHLFLLQSWPKFSSAWAWSEMNAMNMFVEAGSFWNVEFRKRTERFCFSAWPSKSVNPSNNKLATCQLKCQNWPAAHSLLSLRGQNFDCRDSFLFVEPSPSALVCSNSLSGFFSIERLTSHVRAEENIKWKLFSCQISKPVNGYRKTI